MFLKNRDCRDSNERRNIGRAVTPHLTFRASRLRNHRCNVPVSEILFRRQLGVLRPVLRPKAAAAEAIVSRRAKRYDSFMVDPHHSHSHHDPNHRHHGHTHGATDPALLTTERGIWAVKWSLIGLAATGLFQLIIVFFSGSVALLADTIHNIGDAATAIPLWIAFTLARRPPSRRFTYGYGRVEDVAGVIVVLTILFSALLTGYESINRLLRPQSVAHLWAVAVASLIGFAGNEMVALFRIRVGKQINSAALVADGYHARVDGLTS